MFLNRLRPMLVCNSGLTLSVQASAFHYCTPRSDKGPYSAVEVGFPNKVVPDLVDYAEDPNNLTGTVYSNVPVSLVMKIIEENEGIDFQAMGVDTYFLEVPKVKK